MAFLALVVVGKAGAVGDVKIDIDISFVQSQGRSKQSARDASSSSRRTEKKDATKRRCALLTSV